MELSTRFLPIKAKNKEGCYSHFLVPALPLRGCCFAGTVEVFISGLHQTYVIYIFSYVPFRFDSHSMIYSVKKALDRSHEL